MNIDDFKSGCVKQKVDPRDRNYIPKFTHWTELNDIDLRPGCKPSRSQGYIGACTAFASTALFDFIRRKNSTVNWQPSPLFTYYATRLAAKLENQDSGATVKEALKSTVRDGVCMERLWPYEQAKYTERPPEEAWLDAEKHQAVEYLWISDFDKNIWLNCLNDGYPFMFGIYLYSSFFDPILSLMGGIIPEPDRDNEKRIGGHCMLAVGYIKNYNGQEYVIVQNSWGTDWGDKGYCYIPMSYMVSNDTFDFWTIKLTEKCEEDTEDPLPPEPTPEPEPPKPEPPLPTPEPPTPTPPVVPEVVVPTVVVPVVESKPKLNWGLTFVLVALGTMILLFLFS